MRTPTSVVVIMAESFLLASFFVMTDSPYRWKFNLKGKGGIGENEGIIEFPEDFVKEISWAMTHLLVIPINLTNTTGRNEPHTTFRGWRRGGEATAIVLFVAAVLFMSAGAIVPPVAGQLPPLASINRPLRGPLQ